MAKHNQKTTKKESRNNQETQETPSMFTLAPLIVIMAVVPLITYYYKYTTTLSSFDWFTPRDTIVDFFLYYKMVFMLVACGCMLLVFAWQLFLGEQKMPAVKALVPLAVYAGLSLLSAILSEYSYHCFHGIYEQFESVWVLLGYCLITYYAFSFLRTEAAIGTTMKWFVAGVVVMSLLGLSQVFYLDFFRTDLGASLITPPNSGEIQFKFEEGRPYLSVYNPNYVGYYTALVIPVITALLFAAKKLWHRIVYGILIASLLLVLFASQSRAGIIALLGSFVVMLICMRRIFLKNWKISVSIVGVVAVAFILINVMNQNILLNRLKTMFDTTPEYHPLSSIETLDDHVAITYNGQALSFYVSQNEEGYDLFALVDGEGQNVDYQFDPSTSLCTISDERFPFTFASLRIEDFSGFVVTVDGHDWFFTNLMKKGDSTYYALGGNNKLCKLTKHEEASDFFATHYYFANGRGFIWTRTFPLLKKYFWLGSGPDTFIIAFPNDDWVGLYNSGHTYEIITKPHCLYLQIAVQTGVPSLVAFLVFFGWYVIDSLRIYWKNDFRDYLAKFGAAALASVIGYLIMGLTNDSCITVAPLFFTLAGMGLGINHVLRAKQK